MSAYVTATSCTDATALINATVPAGITSVIVSGSGTNGALAANETVRLPVTPSVGQSVSMTIVGADATSYIVAPKSLTENWSAAATGTAPKNTKVNGIEMGATADKNKSKSTAKTVTCTFVTDNQWVCAQRSNVGAAL